MTARATLSTVCIEATLDTDVGGRIASIPPTSLRRAMLIADALHTACGRNVAVQTRDSTLPVLVTAVFVKRDAAAAIAQNHPQQDRERNPGGAPEGACVCPSLHGRVPTNRRASSRAKP